MNVLKKIFLIFAVFGLLITASCGPSEISQKLAEGKQLTAKEAKQYAKFKDRFDEEVKTILKEIEETTYKEPTDEEKTLGKRIYLLTTGKVAEFDISRKSCEKFGFPIGSRVDSRYGKAYVVGVYDHNMWFHFDGKKGADDTRGSESREGLMDEGFRLVDETKKEFPANVSQNKPEPVLPPVKKSLPVTEATYDVQDEGAGETVEGVYFEPIKPIPFMKKN